MPGMEAAVEAEMMANGGDERAARALVLENTEQTQMATIQAKLEEAQQQHPNAA